MIVIIDKRDYFQLSPFLYRFLCRSSRREQYPLTFSNLYHFGDQEIFINLSFLFIFNLYQIDPMFDMSLSLNKIENDLWLPFVQLNCQTNIIQQICSNERNHLISLNEKFQRREKLTHMLEIKENLTIDSEKLLIILNNFHKDRIIIKNSLNEHQVQRQMLCFRTGCEAYREIAKHLSQLHILLRDSILI
ncbi:unnamed protein product [Rotaria sp. Silwood2]|nr:unnamed protein product [Rotaria sp. Silwood2]CAF3293459.1 unnamed protein product [Rotaria sp. Silwood2]CAF4306385.1 unnamed protein product [Rotaria sp. Silwood2]